MSSPSEIVAFLRARLDEDEQTALNAQPGSWRYDRERFTVTCSGYPVASWRHEGELASGSPLLDRTGEYMERFDPARVMAEVAAKRRIIAEYERYAAERRRAMNGWGTTEISPILAALALPYADHPNYRDEWRS